MPKTETNRAVDGRTAVSKNWAVASREFTRKLSEANERQTTTARLSRSSRSQTLAQRETGIVWDATQVDFSLLTASKVARVRARFRSALPEYIWDAAALEGNPYTLPEVQTLLEGITVSGHRLEDQDQILALNDAYNEMDRIVEGGDFTLDKLTSDRIHGIVAVHEAIESGHFRGEGEVGGGGLVGLGELGQYHASDPGKRGQTLLDENARLLAFLNELHDPREQAIVYFCAATRRQFYFDGNKRTARIMMTGLLLSHGFDAISISARRRLEFNEKLREMFDTGNATSLMRFIVDCRPPA
ncbi:Fic family protein [Subtercola frigoramans]|uniref:Fic family protein n=1 Tax=Subtercola frigoramans TaxID=120298 RepID=A0ABS2L593_9MICO|nr:hypothetical protein [Subtercola frigoramans]MBM7472232.1 Fic family protein [Subtercola frigoramans]